MKKIYKLIFLLSICFLLFGCSKNNSYKYSGNIYDDSYGYKNKYCYNYFLENNSNQAKLYSDIYLTATEFNHKNPNISASGNEFYSLFKANCKKYDLSLNDTRQVFDMFQYDNPEFFYLSEIDYKDNGSYVSFEIYKDYFKKEERNRIYSVIYREIDMVDKYINNIDDAFDKLTFIYSYVVNNMDFSVDDYDNPNDEYWAHNIVGFFEKNEGVCETYTKTFSLLLNKYKYNNFAAFSTEHVWNVVNVCNEWFMFDLTNDLFGLCEDEFQLAFEEKYEYDDIMINLPKMATSSLSLGDMILYEDGVEIYKSHSIDDIYRKFNGGNYEIVLDALNATNVYYRKFPISYINTNYNTLRIISNDPNRDWIDDVYNTYIILTHDLTIEKDVTIERLRFANREIDFGNTGNYKIPFNIIVKDGATLTVSRKVITGDNIIVLDD